MYSCLGDESSIETLPLPEAIKMSMRELYSHTIQSHLPDYRRFREFVFRPPPADTRLYCTLVREDDPSTTTGGLESTYILYLEYLGGLVPLLKGKRSSKLKPEFVIYDPQEESERPTVTTTTTTTTSVATPKLRSRSPWRCTPDRSDNEDSVSGCYLTPKTRRRLRSAQVTRHNHHHLHNHRSLQQYNPSPGIDGTATPTSGKSVLIDNLPERDKILLVSSNLWGTKFKFLGLTPLLPSFLGSITYRTSVLHLKVKPILQTLI